MATVGIPYAYLWCIAPGIDSMPPTVILPAIAGIASAATCGVITFAADISTRAQVPMIIVGYILIGLSLPTALCLIVIFIARLLNGSWPPRSKAPLTYVIIGPLGQASYALMILGTSAASPGPGSFGTYNKGRFITENAGQIVEATSILLALMVWGYGTFWIIFALIESIHLGLFKGGGIKNMGYNVSMWSPVFPVVGCLAALPRYVANKYVQGVYTLATLEFGKLMNAPAWDALSEAYVSIAPRQLTCTRLTIFVAWPSCFSACGSLTPFFHWVRCSGRLEVIGARTQSQKSVYIRGDSTR